MKNPNGYGTVYKLSGKRRKPFIARKTIGWDANGKQLYQTIGYYEKRDKAMQALAEYNANPYSVEVSTITFSEVFDKWKDGKFETISKSNINGYNASFKTCASIHDMKFVEIRPTHMQDIIRKCGKGYGTLRKLKVLFNQLYKYAMANDIVSKDYSKYIDIGKDSGKTSRKPFTAKEINKLFKVKDSIDLADTILIMIYTGLRVGELIIIKNTDIDLSKRIIKGGIKTEAGKDRIIPINDKIYDMVTNRVEQGYEYLVSKPDNKPYKYDNYYRDNFKPIMEQLGFKHKPHDCRHTFATLMANAGADTIATQKIIGHASYQTTANIYTHKDVEELQKAINMI
ncbi:MAG: site-specific integrase [Vallitalea sp.]|jgi:integrase|nr:site-specific integrase [Vallitalea sp.]